MNKVRDVSFAVSRGLSILYICFLGIFAADVFSLSKSGSEVLLSLVIHLIPNIIFLMALIIAWRHERLGGGIFFILGLFATIFFRTYTSPINFTLVSFPIFLIAVLFLTHNVLENKKP